MSSQTQSARMPLLFIGHGSPMNALADNGYTQMLANLGRDLPRPKAILVVSAHWVTKGTWFTGMKQPKTIHDFYGFPQALFDVQYPAPGAPVIADEARGLITGANIDAQEWGLDHGTWAVLKHMYPEAKIPVFQMSLDHMASPEEHFKRGEALRKLRDQGVLILGSGNLVHNLRTIAWDPSAPTHAWALEFDQWTKEKLESRDVKSLLLGANASEAARLSIPTPEHYLPLLTILGAADSKDDLKFEFEEMQNASISMRSLSLGRAG